MQHPETDSSTAVASSSSSSKRLVNSNGNEVFANLVAGHTFTVSSRFALGESKILGRGSFGIVSTAFDTIRKEFVAIKRIRPFANDEWDARHTLREIRLMRLLGPHPNVISLYDVSLFEDKTELYLTMELMDCDLHRVIQSKQALSDKHFKCFVRQMLEGIKAMHAIGVFHRDLKPGEYPPNLLLPCSHSIRSLSVANSLMILVVCNYYRTTPHHTSSVLIIVVFF